MQATSVKPRFLVLLAYRNGASFIQKQIDSILLQLEVDVKILIRDDGSTDGSFGFLQETFSAEKRIEIWPDNSATGSASQNFFELIRIANAEGFDFVAFSDQDDEWLPEKLHRAADTLSRSDAVGYSSATMAQWPDKRQKVLAQATRTTLADYLFEGAGQGCTFVIKSAHFQRLQSIIRENSEPFQAIHYHDWAVYAITRCLGGIWHFDETPTMLYMQHAGNDTGAKASGAGIRRRLQLIATGWYADQVAAICRMLVLTVRGNAQARYWIDSTSTSTSIAEAKRLRRMVFVARRGRRNLRDRTITILAVALGYL